VAVCEKCGSDDLTGDGQLSDGRLQVRCLACGHAWLRGTARPVSTGTAPAAAGNASGTGATGAGSPAGEPPAKRSGGPSAVHDRALRAVAAEIGRLGGTATVVRNGRQQEVHASGDVAGREVILLVHGRASGDWQTTIEYGREREPELMPYRFWVMVDFTADPAQF